MAKLVPIPVPPEGEVALVVARDVPYAVVSTGGVPCAFVAACSHKALALVPLRRKKGAIVCPHHGARFDPVTGACVDDAGKDVPTGLAPVDVERGEDGGGSSVPEDAIESSSGRRSARGSPPAPDRRAVGVDSADGREPQVDRSDPRIG